MILTEKDEAVIKTRYLWANPHRLQTWVRDLLETTAQLRAEKAVLGQNLRGRLELPCGCMEPAKNRGEMCPAHRQASGT